MKQTKKKRISKAKGLNPLAQCNGPAWSLHPTTEEDVFFSNANGTSIKLDPTPAISVAGANCTTRLKWKREFGEPEAL